MSKPAQNAAHTRRRLYLTLGALLLVAAVAAVSAAAGSWFVLRTNSEVSSEPAAEPSTSAPSPGLDENRFVPEAGQAMAHDRFQVRFPHTTEGATSLALVYLQALSTNDAETLALVFDAYADTEDPEADVQEWLFPARVHDIEAFLPAFDREEFPAPGSYYYIDPLAVAWDEVDADTVDVWVLANEEVSDGESVFTRSYIHGMRLEWDPWVRFGDWVITDVEDPSGSMAFDLGDEYYSLDHELWTPVFFPEGEMGD